MGWTTEEYGKSHAGWVGAVLEDGTEPKTAFLDPGSGTNFAETREWWAYRGILNRPKAARARGACSCGWRGQSEYPIDWEQLDGITEDFPLPDPLDDWKRHLEDVDRGTVPIPAPVTVALATVEEQVERLLMDSPLAALKAAGALERLAKRIGVQAAEDAVLEGFSGADVAQALGLSESAGDSLLLRHRLGR